MYMLNNWHLAFQVFSYTFWLLNIYYFVFLQYIL